DIERVADHRCRKRVRDVVPSGHAKLGRLAQDGTPVGVHEHEIAVSIEVRAPFRLQRQREATHLGCRAGVHGHGSGGVQIEDRDVERALPGHDVLLAAMYASGVPWWARWSSRT